LFTFIDSTVYNIAEQYIGGTKMKLTLLGTGNALVTKCYNTCFVLSENGEYFLVDAGGGNQIFSQLEKVGMKWQDMKHIFVTHKHLDHIMGIIWMIRMITQYMNKDKYEGDAYIYGHEEVIGLLRDFADKLLPKKSTRFIDDRLHLVKLKDGDHFEVLGHPATAFDIQSTKAKQFGFMVEYAPGKKLCDCGDEPYNPCEEQYAKGAEWLLHEAFCLYGERDIFSPYEKHHSTVKDAAELAESLGVKNLILYHTEDKNLEHRKELYTAEGKEYYHGNLYVPYDLEDVKVL